MNAMRNSLALVAAVATLALSAVAPAGARGLALPSSLVKMKEQIPDGPASAFGCAVAAIGDLNGDGVQDFAVGARAAGADVGAVWILFMHHDGSVASTVPVSPLTNPALASMLHPGDEFGASVTPIGDLDGDGVPDLAVGAPDDDDVNPNHVGGLGIDRGAVYILLMTPGGQPKAIYKLSDLTAGLSLPSDFEHFGASLASLGDFDGPGPANLTLAVGAPGDRDADGGTGFMRGAVFEVFLTWNGALQLPAVQHVVKLSDTQGTPTDLHLHDTDLFGASVANLHDLDGDGVPDLVVGAPLDDDNADGDTGPAANRGAAYVLLLNPDGTVRRDQKISATAGGFTEHLGRSNFFGDGVAGLPDVDGNGALDLAVGAGGYDDAPHAGATFVVLLAYDHGTGVISVKQPLRISNNSGNLGGGLHPDDAFGAAVASIGDLDGDGFPDLLAGAPGDGVSGTASAWVLNLGRSPVSLASSLNPSDAGDNVEFAATVAPGTGTVQFRDGSTVLGTSTLVSGTALYDTNLLSPGSHPMSAYYSGDSLNIGGPSPVLIQFVNSPTATLLAMFVADPQPDGIEIRWQLGQPGQYTSSVLERADAGTDAWSAVSAPAKTVDGVSTVLDADVVAGSAYTYRLRVTRQDGSTQTLGQLNATAAQVVTAFALGPVSPNPATGPVAVSFAVPRTSAVQVSLLDVQGREVATLAEGVHSPGVYQVTWTGEGTRGPAPAGVYFVRYQTPGRTFTRRLVLER